MGPVVEIANGLNTLRNVYQKVFTLQMFTGHYGVSVGFPWKRAVRITENLYTAQRERLCMLWGNPVIFTDCGENPMIAIGFPRNL